MKRVVFAFFGMMAIIILSNLWHSVAKAEILAMVNYETKPGQTFRKEGIAIIDVDPNSANFGKILVDMPLPHDLHNHHIFYNRDASKAYMTVFGENALYVIDLKRFPY
ncbi:MAG: YncE family protein, partial [Deltaproteobacteria bacterium]|nr:YncE family protein [Deltaproteobacteria bacterium]